MNVKATTATLNNKISSDSSFAYLFYHGIIAPLSQMPKIDDYCIFIDLSITNEGTQVIFHDGGATYDSSIDDMVQTDYLSFDTNIIIDNSYKLYYSVSEEVLCFLHER